MSDVAAIVDEARSRVVDAGPLRVALAISLVLHGVVFFWGHLRQEGDGASRGIRSFEVSLTRARPPAPDRVAPAPTPVLEPSADPDSAPGATDTAPPAALAVDPAPLAARAPLPDSPTRLDLSLPAEVIAPEVEARPDDGVFDPALRERIDAARTAQRGPGSVDEVRTWSRGAGDRTRIETDRGCYERVDDPFSDQPGQQWWRVECSAGNVIDWGRRFRGRP